MALFRKNRAEVVRRGVGETAVEERKTRRVGGSTVEIRRVTEVISDPKQKPRERRRAESSRRAPRVSRSRGSTRPIPEYVAPPPSTERKQMLVRRTPHQTQIVVLEGALLVEHYVARSDKPSLTNNIYLGKVRNVLPGMEAAFVDFGEAKNGVLYAGDVAANGNGNGQKKQRIEKALKTGDEILVQVEKDAMGHKGARLTNLINLSGRYVVLDPKVDKPSVSRRLSDSERDRLKDLARELTAEFDLGARDDRAHRRRGGLQGGDRRRHRATSPGLGRHPGVASQGRRPQAHLRRASARHPRHS
jgi:ribonuclease E